MPPNVLVGKLWTNKIDGDKIPVKFLNYFSGNPESSYIGFLFSVNKKKIILHLSYNSFRKIEKIVLLSQLKKNEQTNGSPLN